eukprot:m.19015 g.19015  ORF g.19015 m.19015 type:complete len:79 (+) comp5052_c1_seq1:323-559(+)
MRLLALQSSTTINRTGISNVDNHGLLYAPTLPSFRGHAQCWCNHQCQNGVAPPTSIHIHPAFEAFRESASPTSSPSTS